jgi:hypothetical protein
MFKGTDENHANRSQCLLQDSNWVEAIGSTDTDSESNMAK